MSHAVLLEYHELWKLQHAKWKHKKMGTINLTTCEFRDVSALEIQIALTTTIPGPDHDDAMKFYDSNLAPLACGLARILHIMLRTGNYHLGPGWMRPKGPEIRGPQVTRTSSPTYTFTHHSH